MEGLRCALEGAMSGPRRVHGGRKARPWRVHNGSMEVLRCAMEGICWFLAGP